MTKKRWREISFQEQMGNIISEVGRVIQLKENKEGREAKISFEITFQLIEDTLEDKRWSEKEKDKVENLKEMLISYFYSKGKSGISADVLKQYCQPLAFEAADELEERLKMLLPNK